MTPLEGVLKITFKLQIAYRIYSLYKYLGRSVGGGKHLA